MKPSGLDPGAEGSEGAPEPGVDGLDGAQRPGWAFRAYILAGVVVFAAALAGSLGYAAAIGGGLLGMVAAWLVGDLFLHVRGADANLPYALFSRADGDRKAASRHRER
jgi:hypothetical protein